MPPSLLVTSKCNTVTGKHQKGAKIVKNTLFDTLTLEKTTQQHIKASNHLVTMFSSEAKETSHHHAPTTFGVHKEDAHKTLTTTPAASIIRASVSGQPKSSKFSYYHQQPPIP